MSNKIIQFALMKTIYDNKSNLLECFYPFVLQSLFTGVEYASISCQSRISDVIDLDIPIHVLQKIIRLGKKRSHINISNEKDLWPISINENGHGYVKSLNDTREIERRINALVSGFRNYLSAMGIVLPIDKIKEDIEAYIKKNAYVLSDFVIGAKGFQSTKFADNEKEFTKYILEIEKNKPIEYNILREMFYGAVISNSLNLNEKEFNGVINSNFKNTKIYFDANYLFSLLEYHDEELFVPAKELHKLLLKFGFELRVFDFTISEMNHVLKNYVKSQNVYSSNVKVMSLYSVLKRKGITASDIIDIISGIEESLKKKKIYIKTTDVNLDKYIPVDSSLSAELQRLKPSQGHLYHQHDVCLMEKAHVIRKKRCFNFESANSFIITSDYKLSKLTYAFFRHGDDNSISEIIMDRTMTNILFLKNPSVDLSLSTIISGFSTGLFVDRLIWEKFYEVLKRLKKDESIEEERISNLFYHGYIENELLNIESTDAIEITEEFVLDKIEEAARKKRIEDDIVLTQLENEYESLIENKEHEHKDKLKNSEAHLKGQIEEEKRKHLQEIKSENKKNRIIIETQKEEYENKIDELDIERRIKIESMAKKDAGKITNAIRIAFGMILLIPLFLSIYSFANTGEFSTSLMSIIRYSWFILNSFVLSIDKVWEKLEKTLFIRRKVKLERSLL